MVPPPRLLATALSGPLLELERRFLDGMPEIEQWLRGQRQEHAVPYGTDEELFVIVEADAGNYDMGIMTVRDASVITGLICNQRNKMEELANAA